MVINLKFVTKRLLSKKSRSFMGVPRSSDHCKGNGTLFPNLHFSHANNSFFPGCFLKYHFLTRMIYESEVFSFAGFLGKITHLHA